MKLSDQLFKRKVDEAEKEFTFTEFLNLVDSNTGGSPASTVLVVLPFSSGPVGHGVVFYRHPPPAFL